MPKGGLILTTGNARTLSASARLLFGYKLSRHKASAEAGLAYVRSDLLVAIDDDVAPDPEAGTIEEDEIDRDLKIAECRVLRQGALRLLPDRAAVALRGWRARGGPAGRQALLHWREARRERVHREERAARAGGLASGIF